MANARYIPPPRFTPAPNELFDELLPQIETLGEMKVTLAIIRQTFGWRRQERMLTFSQLQEMTGLARGSVSAGIAAALERGYVGRRRGEGNAYFYGLRVRESDQNLGRVQMLNRENGERGSDVEPPSIEGKKETTPKSKETSEDRALEERARRHFDLWAELCRPGRRVTFTDKRKVPTVARCRKYPDADIELAIRNVAASAWHREQGQDDLELVCRNDQNLEKYRDRTDFARANGNASTHRGEPERRTHHGTPQIRYPGGDWKTDYDAAIDRD